MESLDVLVERIVAGSGKTREQVHKLIREKQDELSGLVSGDGAAYIVGRELGVSLIKERRKLKVSNLVPNLNSVDIVARVVGVFEPREFNRNGREGKVQNILLGDDTGTVRVSLWNHELALVQKLGIKEGAAVEISGGYTKQDNLGNPELRVGRGMIKVVEPGDLPQPEDISASPPQASDGGQGLQRSARRKGIEDLKEGDYAEVRAAVVQIFPRNPFYEVCPLCGSRVSQQDGKWSCKEHGGVEPSYQIVAAGFIDDGTGNIRAVFFREAAEKVFGRPVDELRKAVDEKKATEAAFESVQGLGREFILHGRVRKNALTDNVEFIVGRIEDIDPKKEAEAVMDSLGV